MYSIRYYYYLDDAIIEMATSTMQMVRSTTELIAHMNSGFLALNSYKIFVYCKMALQYYVSRIQGNLANLNSLLKSLTNEVNLYVANGATLVGGVSICYVGANVVISQAMWVPVR